MSTREFHFAMVQAKVQEGAARPVGSLSGHSYVYTPVRWRPGSKPSRQTELTPQ